MPHISDVNPATLHWLNGDRVSFKFGMPKIKGLPQSHVADCHRYLINIARFSTTSMKMSNTPIYLQP